MNKVWVVLEETNPPDDGNYDTELISVHLSQGGAEATFRDAVSEHLRTRVRHTFEIEVLP